MKHFSKVVLLFTIFIAAGACKKTVEYKQVATKLTDFEIPVKKLGDADFEVTPPKTNSYAPIKYKSSNLKVATITGTTIKIIGLGSTTITAYQEATANFTADSIQASLITEYRNPVLSDFSFPDKQVGDAPFKPTPPKSNSAGAFTYSSNNRLVATTDGKTITITGAGTAEITAVQAYSGIYSSMAIKATLTVKEAPVPDKVQDADGVYYGTVKIGTQVWMTSNLRTSHYRNGDKINEVNDEAQWKALKTGAYCGYNNDVPTRRAYGELYNWYAVHDPRGIAPVGWHVATDADWKKLYDYIGDVRQGGDKIKEKGTTHWDNELTATNSTKFTALGAGYRQSATYPFGFTGLKNDTRWWSATTASKGNAWYYSLYVKGYFERHEASYIDGYSVRCVKD